MTRVLTLCVGLILLPSASAFAAGANLSWNDCVFGATAAANRNFACDTNSGSHLLVGSFDPPAGIDHMSGIQASVDVTSDACPLPSWWQLFNVGSCRRTSLSAWPAPLEGQMACADLWQGALPTTYVSGYLTGFDGSYRRARIVVGIALNGFDVPAAPGTEYYAFNLQIRNTNTVGVGACAGCATSACIELSELKLVQPPGTPGGSPILHSLYFVIWQGSAGAECARYKGPPLPDCTTPVVKRAWGQIKGIYR
jgi:hypothetical protein